MSSPPAAPDASAASATTNRLDSPDPAQRIEAAFIRTLQRPHLGRELVLVALLLSAPCLFIGFYLDDYIARYVYSELPGAQHLFHVLDGGYALAKGDPVETHWQIEQGYAPWWTYPQLRLSLLRPISLLTHLLDGAAWPEHAWLMHAQSLVWLALLVLALTRMYRGLHGTLVGGLVALLFAFDHTHGFVVGYICNRHALVTALFGVLALDAHVRGRKGDRLASWIAPALYVLSLLAGESALAICGYLVAYAFFAEEGRPLERALSVAPYVLITLVWRVAYTRAGYGAVGSGLYLDPGREPLHYLAIMLERGPILLFSLFFGVPAELYVVGGKLIATAMLVLAALLLLGLVLALWPLWKRDRLSRFWSAGLLFSLVPACSTFPHSRQLLFASLGALPLIAQLWHLHLFELKSREHNPKAQHLAIAGAIAWFAHLIVAPILQPVMVCSVAVSAPLARGAASVRDDLTGKDAVFLSAPDYFAFKIVQLSRRVDRKTLPEHWRALSFGPEQVTVTRDDAHTLTLDYAGGILSTSFMELYRDRRLPMARGERIELQGMSIEVLEVTNDGRAKRARFRFDKSLDDPSFKFYYWTAGSFAPYQPPAIGKREELPAATLEWGLS